MLNKLKSVLLKEFDQAKNFLQEKNAKLTMVAKTQERLAQKKMVQQSKTMELEKNKTPVEN